MGARCDPLPIGVGTGIGIGSRLGHPSVTQAPRLGHPWVDWWIGLCFQQRLEKRGVRGARSAPIAGIPPQKAKTGLSGGPGESRVIADIARDRKGKASPRRRGDTEKSQGQEVGTVTTDTDFGRNRPFWLVEKHHCCC